MSHDHGRMGKGTATNAPPAVPLGHNGVAPPDPKSNSTANPRATAPTPFQPAAIQIDGVAPLGGRKRINTKINRAKFRKIKQAFVGNAIAFWYHLIP